MLVLAVALGSCACSPKDRIEDFARRSEGDRPTSAAKLADSELLLAALLSANSGFVSFESDARSLVPRFTPRPKTSTASPALVEYPTLASGPVRVTDLESGASISFKQLDANPNSRAVPSSGVVHYPGGSLDRFEAFHRPSFEGTEDFVFFESKPVLERVTYQVDVSKVAGLRLVSNVLEFLDDGGAPRLRVASPYVVLAGGERRPAVLDVDDCYVSRDPAPPWGHAVIAPGSDECLVSVDWSRSGASYPALVDPVWQTTGSMTVARYNHRAAPLPSGRVLAAGGQSEVEATAEVYDEASGTWTRVADMPGALRSGALVPLDGGQVLALSDPGTQADSNKVFDETTGEWTVVAPLDEPRSILAAPLPGGGRDCHRLPLGLG